jgi:hypothetical protein
MNISLVEMNISKQINYSTDICWNGQGTTISYVDNDHKFQNATVTMTMVKLTLITVTKREMIKVSLVIAIVQSKKISVINLS